MVDDIDIENKKIIRIVNKIIDLNNMVEIDSVLEYNKADIENGKINFQLED